MKRGMVHRVEYDLPARNGRLERRNGWSARANTKGRTGRMHGLRIVSTPPTKANK